jgi:hypothetical protein
LFAFFPSTLGRTEFRKQAADVVAKAAIKVDHVDDLKQSLPRLKNNDQKKSVIREIDSEIRKGLLLSVHELVRSRPASHVVLVGECHDHTTPETAHSPSARRFLLALARAAIANPRARVAIEAHTATWDNYRDPLAQKITEISEDDKRSLRWEVEATLAIGALDRVHAMDKRSHASDATDEADQFFEDAAFTLQKSEHSGVIACLREHLAKDGEPDNTVGKRRFDLLRRLYPPEASSHYFNVNSVTRQGSVRVLVTTEVVVVYLSQLHTSGHIADLEPLSAYCNAVGCSHSPNPGRLLCTSATLPTNEERRKAVYRLAFAAMGCEYSTFNGEPSAARAILGSLGCRTDGTDKAVVDWLCYAAEDFMLLPEDNASWRHQRLNTPTQDLLRREVAHEQTHLTGAFCTTHQLRQLIAEAAADWTGVAENKINFMCSLYADACMDVRTAALIADGRVSHTWLGYFGYQHVRRIHSMLTARHGYRMQFSACKRPKYASLRRIPKAEQERC